MAPIVEVSFDGTKMDPVQFGSKRNLPNRFLGGLKSPNTLMV